jgi:hypothetical protein
MAIRGWVSPSHSERKAFDEHASVVGPVHGHPDNREVTSKNTRRYGRNETTGQQPAEIYRDEVSGDSPITHHNKPFVHHVEVAGHVPNSGGQWAHPTHPNAEAKSAGNSKFTHAPLEPVGQTHSKYGGEHGKEQTRPESDPTRGARTAPHGHLNTRRDRNR